MTEQEALEILEEVKELDDTLYAYSDAYMKALEVALSVLREIQNYRKLGTLEELARVKKYIDLAKKHGTIGEMIDECAEYESIGTVEKCREAIEKQKPKVPDYEGDGYADGYMVYDTWICPNCGKKYEVDYDDYKHCPECGQAIDENLEGMEDE